MNKYTLDYSIFDRDTISLWYWIGFLYADGCVRRTKGGSYKVCLSSIDEEIPVKFKNFVQWTGPVRYRISNLNPNKGSFHLEICQKRLYDILQNKFDIHPNKSTIEYYTQVQIPIEFHSHFLRGYIDGDGHIGWATEMGCKIPLVGITFGTRSFLDFINQLIQYTIGYKLWIAKPCGTTTAWNLKRTRQKALQLLDWVYSNSTEDTRLSRKYNRYREISKWQTI